MWSSFFQSWALTIHLVFKKRSSMQRLNKLKNSGMQEENIVAAETGTQNGGNSKLRLPVQF